MTEKITDLQKARRKKRDKAGWSIEEIKKRAEEERANYKKLTKEEPDALASGGDMTKIMEEEEEEEEEEDEDEDDHDED